MMANQDILNEGINEVTNGINTGLNYLNDKGKYLFNKNPIAVVATAFVLGLGVAYLTSSMKKAMPEKDIQTV
jgi:hypothetical protein